MYTVIHIVVKPPDATHILHLLHKYPASQFCTNNTLFCGIAYNTCLLPIAAFTRLECLQTLKVNSVYKHTTFSAPSIFLSLLFIPFNFILLILTTLPNFHHPLPPTSPLHLWRRLQLALKCLAWIDIGVHSKQLFHTLLHTVTRSYTLLNTVKRNHKLKFSVKCSHTQRYTVKRNYCYRALSMEIKSYMCFQMQSYCITHCQNQSHSATSCQTLC